MSEIIVYLDEYEYSGDGKFDTIYIDFRTNADFEHFIEETGEQLTTGSYIQINNYNSPRRLQRGCYYALNVNMLKQLQPEYNIDSHLIGRTYDFSKYEGENNKQTHLLMTHQPLDASELRSGHNSALTSMDALNMTNDLEFRVNDVSQGNWNEVRQGGKVRMVYDIGAPIHANAVELQQYISQYAVQYATDRPYLVLSHWDVDHYHCLMQMTNAEIRNFSKFICVDNMKSATSKKLYERMELVLGANDVVCYTLGPRTRRTPFPQMHELFQNDAVSIYLGEKSRTTNYSGIVVYVHSDDNHVLLTGDCLPCQADQALNHLNAKHRLNSGHFLVVPHHGGDFKSRYKTYNIVHRLHAIGAIISVDRKNNSYGHLDSSMLNWP